MDRAIVYAGSGVVDTDILRIQRYARRASSWAMRFVLGSRKTQDTVYLSELYVAGINASGQLVISNGAIYSSRTGQQEDAGQLGSLTASPYNMNVLGVLQYALAVGPFPAPAQAGQSINYLVYGSILGVQGDPQVLYYQNADNPAQTFRGVGNLGQPQNTTLYETIAVGVVAGAAAATGTQATPAVPANCVGMYVVTVNYGDAQAQLGNVARHPAANFVAGLMDHHHAGTPGQAPQILIGTEIPASDTLGAISAVQTCYGNPNGQLAGNTGTAGGPPSLAWDYYGQRMYAAIASGNSATTVWRIISGRIILTQALNMWVDTVNGSDLNNGLTAATPLKTLQAAWDRIVSVFDLNNFGVTVYVVAGYYAPARVVGAPVGFGSNSYINFVGDTANPSNVTIGAPGGTCIAAAFGALITVLGMRFVATGNAQDYNSVGIGLTASLGGFITFGYCVFDNCDSGHINAQGGNIGTNGMPYTIVGGCPNGSHVSATTGGNATLTNSTVTIYNNPLFQNFAFVNFAYVYVKNVTFNGTVRGKHFTATNNGIIQTGITDQTGAANDNYLPGDAAGVRYNGGICY